MSSSSADWNRLLAKHVEAAKQISDEEEFEAVWKEILERRGLPLDTPYEYDDRSYKDYDESYCDRLFLTISEKKKNPEAAKSWGYSAFEWLPAPAPPAPAASAPIKILTFDERKEKKYSSINHILYQDDVSQNKLKDYAMKKRQEKMELYKQYQAKLGPNATFLTLT